MQAVIIASNQEDRDFFSFVLRHAGLAVARGSDVHHIRAMLPEHAIDLILLAPDDSQLSPDQLTTEITALRALTQAPLILVIETLSEEEYCGLLDAGVDLVLKRPLSHRILSRYVRMLLRRAGTVPASVLPTLNAPGISLSPANRTVAVSGEERTLTPLEFRLLYVLMTNPNQVIDVDLIVERVWGYSGEGNRELVRGLVRRLRRKIEPDPNQPRYIQNLPGVGYRFDIDE